MMSREALLDEMAQFRMLDKTSLVRIECGKLNPSQDTFVLLVKPLGVPQEGFVTHKIDNQRMRASLLRDYLGQALDFGNFEQAESILARLKEMEGFDSGVKRQFICSKEAQLLEQLGKPTSEIIPMIDEGMSITFGNYDENCIDGAALILEELELLHTKARLYARDGDIKGAIKILSGMKTNLARLPVTDRDKKGQIAPVLLSLARCLLQAGDYEEVLETCTLGAECSAKFRRGRYNPDFEYYTAIALNNLGRTAECLPHLQNSYYGFMLNGEAEKAQYVLRSARESFGIQIDHYDADETNICQQPKTPYNRGELVVCDSLGTLISALRYKAGLSLEGLCHGICNKSTLYRIENGDFPGCIFMLEALMQRLGREVHLHTDFFLSTDDFESLQLRDRIDELLIARRGEEAEVSLAELESKRSFVKYNTNRQFIEMAKALIYASKCKSPPPDLPKKLLDALAMTCKDFTVRFIDRYQLTYTEAFIINAYAGYYKDIGDDKQATDIYERLHRNLKEHYVDELAKARLFAAVALNYSSCLCRMGRWEESLEVSGVVMGIEQSHLRLTMLPGLSYTKGYCLLELGYRKESIQFFAMAYYVARMFAPYDNAKAAGASITYSFVETMLGLTFS